jgi:predicted nucleotidyltransferase component of viral defense system
MNLDKNKHRQIMLKILDEISSNTLLANQLGFKGGTACYFLHGLDRFSVDLDFDLLDEKKEVAVKQELLTLLAEYGSVKTKTSIKLKYSDQHQSLKIDLSNRYDKNELNIYEVKDIVSGVALKVLQKEDIFAHKLVALTDRSSSLGDKEKFIANRDLYDINFFFKNDWAFNEEIIKMQTGKSAIEYLRYAKEFIEKYADEKNILARLGELVDDKKRDWVKKNLKNEVVKQLSIQVASMRD